MGTSWSDCFIDPTVLPDNGYGFVQLIFLLVIYSCILFYSATILTEGSELLLLIPAYAGVVGSIVLPVLGAVPDGAIVLFSGMGDNAQEELNVGIGALAGSTVLLLTVPWGVAIIAGRVNIDPEGFAKGYEEKPDLRVDPPGSMNLMGLGVEMGKSISRNGMIMGVTAFAYVIVQGSAFQNCWKKDDADCDADDEKIYAIVAMVFSLVGFFAYLGYAVYISKKEMNIVLRDKLFKSTLKAMRKGHMTLGHLIHQKVLDRAPTMVGEESTEGTNLTQQQSALNQLLKAFFRRYDKNCDNKISKEELPKLMREMNEQMSFSDENEFMKKFDTNNDGQIGFKEFKMVIMEIYKSEELKFASKLEQAPEGHDMESVAGEKAGAKWFRGSVRGSGTMNDDDDDNQEDNEVEVPEEWADLSEADRESKIKSRAFMLMAAGTLLIMIFSDPMVSVLQEVGVRIHVGSFYVAFVLAPLASNSSEVLAAYVYGAKKTANGVTTACETLVGAAIMNNTFVLMIFLLIVIAKGLKWEYTAETITILLIQIVMFFYTQRPKQKVLDAFIILSLFPLSIVVVWTLENVAELN